MENKQPNNKQETNKTNNQQKQNQQQETNIKKDINNNPTKQTNNANDLNQKVNELLANNTLLTNQLKEKDAKIAQLENQIKTFNDNYVNEIAKKANEANKIVESKIKEQQEKFDKEVAHIKKFALKDKAIELIDIVNNFDVAVSFNPDDAKLANYVQGFRMFSTMFKNYLANNNITEIVANVGDNYDPLTMEALEAQSDPNFKTNQVIKVIKKGYKLHDVVLIPTSVIVCKDKKDKN